MAVVLVTHDMGVVAMFADDVAVMYAGQFVEYGPVDEVFHAPEHPYTEALLAALPQLMVDREPGMAFPTIPGRPPDLVDLPVGCRFAPRCPFGTLGDDCAVTPLELVEIQQRHWVRSLHPRSSREASRRATSALERSESER